ncbi:MAG TPA: 8-amino-7-oxononanoate synthase [Planctomicrobium sp.]|nr:8-amino-7-oxononanoate synthase [Planctomicrobium sp.]
MLLSQLTDELTALSQSGLRRSRREVNVLPGGRCQIGDRTLWNFASNDYLGLADDARLIHAATQAMQESGVGARASPLVTGRTRWHVQLEERLSRFKNSEATILFPTGFAANVGAITALAGPDDVILCDRLNHASLIDGSRLSRAKLRVVPHCDVDAVRHQLVRATDFRRRLIVTDSVFSMDGDHAPLRELAALAEEFDAILLVDEAHATGVFGTRGTGLLEEQNVTSSRVIAVGTLSKGMGLQGGFVSGSRILIDWLWNTARTQVFSTGLSVPVCAAAVVACDLIEADPQRRQWLKENSHKVITALREQGWTIPEQARGPIIPVLIGAPDETIRLVGELEQRGILVAGIRPPTVPPRTSRLRLSLNYAHGDEGITQLISAFQSLLGTGKHCFPERD